VIAAPSDVLEGDVSELPTLSGAVEAPPAPDAKPEPEAPEVKAEPISSEQILVLVAQISAFGLSPAESRAYIEGLTSDGMILLLLRMSQLEQTLADMGISLGSGKLPQWLSLTLGLGALGLGIWSHRSRFASVPAPRVMTSEESEATPEPEAARVAPEENQFFEPVPPDAGALLEVGA
jgi:hypothetical protein